MKKAYNYIYRHLYWAKNWIIMFWAKILIFFGHKYDEAVIPKNTPYCYTPLKYENHILYTKPCPYFKKLGKYWDGCKLLGVIANYDLLLHDQCKVCGISHDFEENSLNNVKED